MNGRYKQALDLASIGFGRLTYTGRYIKYSEVLGKYDIRLNERYASLAIF